MCTPMVLGFCSAHQGGGCEPTRDSIAATIFGRQALRLLQQ
jgi:hypothetical protein